MIVMHHRRVVGHAFATMALIVEYDVISVNALTNLADVCLRCCSSRSILLYMYLDRIGGVDSGQRMLWP